MSASALVEYAINKLAPNSFANESNDNKAIDAINNAVNKMYNRSPLMWVLSILNWVVQFYAIYLSFKCNKGFNLGSFLVACCCSYFYVAYRVAVPC